MVGGTRALNQHMALLVTHMRNVHRRQWIARQDDQSLAWRNRLEGFARHQRRERTFQPAQIQFIHPKYQMGA